MKTYLHDLLANNQIFFNDEVETKLITYLDLLHQWNKVFNLTAIRDEHQSVLLHILDSLSIRNYVQGTRILDVGSGAGLPGIPLALAFPEKQFVLLDSNNKKTRFLRQVMYELNLKNIEVIHARCQQFQDEKRFDTILSRAFASIKVMLDTTHHLLAEHGQFLMMKGVYPEDEIREIPDKFKLLNVHKLEIKGLDAQRHIVLIGANAWEK